MADVSKAFDFENYKILLGKLESYGLLGVVHRWMSGCLKNRKQYNEIIGKELVIGETDKRVLQCSILGPLLYNIYVNDYPLERTVLYTDDTTLIISDTANDKVCKKTSQEIMLAHGCFMKKGLHVNRKKRLLSDFLIETEHQTSSLAIES